MIIECNFYLDNKELDIENQATPATFNSEDVLYAYKSIEYPDRTVICFKYKEDTALIDIKFKDYFKCIKTLTPIER